MANSGISRKYWQGKRVLITGHTGFKGSWLALWLQALGAQVHGYALEPPTNPSLFDIVQLNDGLTSHIVGDIRDRDALAAAMQASQPDVLFHMAAQSLVRLSYEEPVETLSTNVLGTAHVLQEARQVSSLRAVINVTSDKCYENTGTGGAFQETDPMGGHDPYSASKGAAELIATAFRRSFYAGSPCGLASVRAGNVIGGGDWAADRLLPDFFRAQANGQPLVIRSPNATRPWQHVLEPLSGYILLAQRIGGGETGLDEGWNFGPGEDSVKTVRWITDYLTGKFGGLVDLDKGPHPHEAAILQLDVTKAQERLGWQPQWDIATALDKSGEWQAAWQSGQDMHDYSLRQISDYPGSGLS